MYNRASIYEYYTSSCPFSTIVLFYDVIIATFIRFVFVEIKIHSLKSSWILTLWLLLVQRICDCILYIYDNDDNDDSYTPYTTSHHHGWVSNR